MRYTNPFGLSLSFDKLRMIGKPFALSLSKGSPQRTLRHGAFDKLSPLLRANGAEIHRESGKTERIIGQRRKEISDGHETCRR
jgi:hypothetical protein